MAPKAIMIGHYTTGLHFARPVYLAVPSELLTTTGLLVTEDDSRYSSCEL